MTSFWRHLWPNYNTLQFKIFTQCVKLLGERVQQVWWRYLHWFRRNRKKTRGGARNSPPPPPSEVRVNHITLSTRSQETRRALQNTNNITTQYCRLTSFRNSLLLDAVHRWNLLSTDTQNQPNLKSFVKAVTKHHDVKKAPHYYSLSTKLGNKLSTKLRLRTSDLNVHLFKIEHTQSPQCMYLRLQKWGVKTFHNTLSKFYPIAIHPHSKYIKCYSWCWRSTGKYNNKRSMKRCRSDKKSRGGCFSRLSVVSDRHGAVCSSGLIALGGTASCGHLAATVGDSSLRRWRVGRRGAAVGGGCGRLYAGEVPRHSLTRLCANPEDDIVYALECDEKINYDDDDEEVADECRIVDEKLQKEYLGAKTCHDEFVMKRKFW